MGQNTINSRLGKPSCETSCETFVCPEKPSCDTWPCFTRYLLHGELHGFTDAGDSNCVWLYHPGCEIGMGTDYKFTPFPMWTVFSGFPDCCYASYAGHHGFYACLGDLIGPLDDLILHSNYRLFIGNATGDDEDDNEWKIIIVLFERNHFGNMMAHVYALENSEAYEALELLCAGECFDVPYVGDITGYGNTQSAGCAGLVNIEPHPDLWNCDPSESYFTICPELLPDTCLQTVQVSATYIGPHCWNWDISISAGDGCDCDIVDRRFAANELCIDVACSDGESIRTFCFREPDCEYDCCECVDDAFGILVNISVPIGGPPTCFEEETNPFNEYVAAEIEWDKICGLFALLEDNGGGDCAQSRKIVLGEWQDTSNPGIYFARYYQELLIGTMLRFDYVYEIEATMDCDTVTVVIKTQSFNADPVTGDLLSGAGGSSFLSDSDSASSDEAICMFSTSAGTVNFDFEIDDAFLNARWPIYDYTPSTTPRAWGCTPFMLRASVGLYADLS